MGMKRLPSNDLISKCFLKEFLKCEPFFIKCMQSLNCRKSLSLDHTFKVATNVSYVQDDGKWVSMYDSVLFVFNEDGNILTWQFTQSTAFDEVEELLRSLHRRISCLGGIVDTIIIDNCCQWRNKLQYLFGQEVDVKLDLFHAVQRVTKKMP